MKNNQDDWGYWSGWVIAFCLAAAFFVYNLWHGSSLRGAVCKLEEEDCFRQWVAALGGWAAVAATVPSIIYLATQVRTTERHHRVSTALSLHRNRALAVHTRNYAVMIRDRITKERSECADVEDAIRFLNTLDKYLSEGHFLEFEEQIEIPKINFAITSHHAGFIRGMLDIVSTDNLYEAEAMANFRDFLDAASMYSTGVQELADKYIRLTARFSDGSLEDC